MKENKTIKIPWSAWHGPVEEKMLSFPDNWHIDVFSIKGAETWDEKRIRDAINAPIGSKPLDELAAGKKSACIVIEDISRPSNLQIICQHIVNTLTKAGIDKGRITIIGAIGAHRPMQRKDYIKKLGKDLVENVNIENHHPYENLIYLGESDAGTPIYLNKTYHEADLKIAIGTVIPHPLAGFGGGAKLILPGICGIETLLSNHQAGIRGIGIGYGIISDLRKDLENVCSKVGLDFCINILTSDSRKIIGIYAGHYIDAHRTAVKKAKIFYDIKIPRLKKQDRFDIIFYNLYPEDLELSQAIKGLNLFLMTRELMRRKQSIAVFMTCSPEGRGFHSLLGETGAKLYQNWGENPITSSLFKDKKLAIFSENVSEFDVHHFFSKDTLLFTSFSKLIQKCEELTIDYPKAAIFTSSLGLISRA
ncbi:MAG: lactate racemase domain-containing protein [Promethearchaeota archaeon]